MTIICFHCGQTLTAGELVLVVVGKDQLGGQLLAHPHCFAMIGRSGLRSAKLAAAVLANVRIDSAPAGSEAEVAQP